MPNPISNLSISSTLIADSSFFLSGYDTQSFVTLQSVGSNYTYMTNDYLYSRATGYSESNNYGYLGGKLMRERRLASGVNGPTVREYYPDTTYRHTVTWTFTENSDYDGGCIIYFGRPDVIDYPQQAFPVAPINPAFKFGMIPISIGLQTFTFIDSALSYGLRYITVPNSYNGDPSYTGNFS